MFFGKSFRKSRSISDVPTTGNALETEPLNSATTPQEITLDNSSTDSEQLLEAPPRVNYTPLSTASPNKINRKSGLSENILSWSEGEQWEFHTSPKELEYKDELRKLFHEQKRLSGTSQTTGDEFVEFAELRESSTESSDQSFFLEGSSSRNITEENQLSRLEWSSIASDIMNSQRYTLMYRHLLDRLKIHLAKYEKELEEYEKSLEAQQQFLIDKTNYLSAYQQNLQAKEKQLSKVIGGISDSATTIERMAQEAGKVKLGKSHTFYRTRLATLKQAIKVSINEYKNQGVFSKDYGWFDINPSDYQRKAAVLVELTKIEEALKRME